MGEPWTPRISIITSVYNGEKFLPTFLQNVEEQSIFNETEILFIDAASNDKSSDLILDFQKKYPKNVVYIKLEEKCSIYKAWNIGVEKSRSRILTNWNLDDRRLNNSLEIQVSEMELDETLDLCYGYTLITDMPNQRVEDCTSRVCFGCFEPSIKSMLENNSPHCLPVWRKNIHDRFGYFNTGFLVAGDYEMWLRALAFGAKFKKLPVLIGSYYENPEGLSSKAEWLAGALKEVEQVRNIYRIYTS